MPFIDSLPWWVFAIAGALFAGATNVFIKAGMKDVNSELATAARTSIAVPVVWLIAVYAAPRISEMANWTYRNWLFITLSAVASGLSWLCAYKSIDMAGVARTLPVDKSSIAFAFILAVIFLGERPHWQTIVATLLVLAALGVTLIPDSQVPSPLPPASAQTSR
jgi:transporter family protein